MNHQCHGYTNHTQEFARCRQEQLACLPEILDGCDGAMRGCADWLLEELLIEEQRIEAEARGVGA